MKAVVLETRGNEAAILVKDGTVRIAYGTYNVGDTIEYNKTSRPLLRYWAAAAAAIVAAVGITAGLWVDRNYITYAEVSLDVNPSIIYSVNKRDCVLSVQAVNEDADAIVEQLKQDSIRFSPLSEAVEKTMGMLESEGYLSEDTDDYVLINVSADDEARQDRLIDEVEDAMTQTMEQDSTLEYHIDRSARDTAREARNSGMSTGRYAAWQEASKEETDSGKPSKEDYATKPVREIIRKGTLSQDEQAPGGKIPGGSVPGSQAPTDQAHNDTVPSGQISDNNTPNGQSPEADQSTPPSGVDSPGPGTESADALNPPSGVNPQADEPQRQEDSGSQPPEASGSQHPEGSAAPQDSAANPGNGVTLPVGAVPQGDSPQHDDTKDDPTDQNESPNTPGANTNAGDGFRQDRSSGKGKSSEKADQSDNKEQSNPSDSSDDKKQIPIGNSNGDKKQTSAGNGDNKSGSSGGNKQGTPGGNGKSNPGHR